MVRIRKLGVGPRMGGPPIAFSTPNFLIRTILRKVAFYAPLPHFENPCLLQLPIAMRACMMTNIHRGQARRGSGAERAAAATAGWGAANVFEYAKFAAVKMLTSVGGRAV